MAPEMRRKITSLETNSHLNLLKSSPLCSLIFLLNDSNEIKHRKIH